MIVKEEEAKMASGFLLGGPWRRDDNCVRRGGRKNSCGVGGGSVTRGNWLFGFKDLK